ncbi:MAG: hypothetical protein IJ009_06975 [Clostridia bacterium]|nr:hypothetical protein [Clostridia bacterium]
MTIFTEMKHELAVKNGLERSHEFIAMAGVSLSPQNADSATKTTANEFPSLFREANEKTLTGLALHGDLTLTDCEGLTLRDTYIFGRLTVKSADVLIENCYFEEVVIMANDVQLRHCNTERGISVVDCENPLVALSVSKEIFICDAHNAVCLLNRTESVTASGCRSLYICENEIKTSLSLSNCDHLIVNGNEADGVSLDMENIAHFVGNNITDINARKEYGVNEALLPQLDKECFLYMPRYACVHEEKKRGIREYLMEEAQEKPFVIVPPGAYQTGAQIAFEKIEDGCVIYAYGVLLEELTYDYTALRICDSRAVVIKGLQVDHIINTTGQGVVVGKGENNTLYIMHAAGMLPDWSDSRYFSGSTLYHYLQGHPDFNSDGIPTRGGFRYNPLTGQIYVRVSSGTLESISVGDTVATRGKGGGLARIDRSADVYFEDMAIYGCAGFAISEGSCSTPTILHRLWNTPKTPALIDRVTYEQYRLYEKEYGVSFGVREEKAPDGSIVYRGTPPICSSVDATHTTGSSVGTTAISCIFESMCDDATNQNSMHSRLHAATDNGDGTLTLVIKSSISYIQFQTKRYDGYKCRPFRVGDRAYVYTSTGKLICDTTVLGVEELPSGQNQWGGKTDYVRLTLPRDGFDMETVKDYDLETDLPSAPKILVDNMSRASCGFVFDNMLIRYVRSRGLLIKTSNGTVRNCSFYKCGKGCIAILYEIQWGESGVSEHLSIKNNYFEETGYLENLPRYSPISIEGLGSEASDEYLLYHDICFEGNVARNRGGTYAVFINSARDVRLINNDFGTRKGEDEENPMPSVYISGAKDVELSGNTYSPYLSDIAEQVLVKKSIHVYGDDTNGELPCTPELFAGLEKSSSLIYPCKLANDGATDFSDTPWSAGYMPVGEISFIPYAYVNGSNWFAADPRKSGENSTGGIQKAAGLFSPQPEYNVAFRYAVPRDMQAHLGFESIEAPTQGSAYLAIFINGKMTWPTKGGSYTKVEDWFLLEGEASGKRAAAISREILDLHAGDEILVVGRQNIGSKVYPVMPVLGIEQ